MERKGKKLENIINKTLRVLNDDKLGYFMKSPIPNKALPNGNGGYKFIYSAKALCDFIGIYRERFILIEAKQVKDKRFAKKRIKQHQIDQLINIYDNGGMSFIIFYIDCLDKYIAMDIQCYLKIDEIENKKSIPVNALVNHGFELQINDDDRLNIMDLFNKYF